MILTLTALAVLSFSVTLLLTPLVRDAFLRRKIVDQPDGGRKQHVNAVPRIGGIPIAIGYATSLLVLWALIQSRDKTPLDEQLVAGLAAGSLAIFLTGILDDLIGLKPWHKLAGQFTAAGILCLSGIRISALGGYGIAGWIAVPVTFAWIVVCTNAFNLVDGLDGLAAGMGLMATLTIFAMAVLTGSATLALTTLPLAASLLAFLVFNFNPASVFLGDSGSLLVGFLLGSYAIVWSQKSATLFGMAAPLMALAIPLADVWIAIARRWLRGQPILTGDRSHIHHKLLERGLSHRGVVLWLYALAGLCAVFALVQSFVPVGVAALPALVFCAALIAGVERLGYLEFHGARRVLSTAALRRSIRHEIAVQTLAQRLAEATTSVMCWEVLCEAARQMGFSEVEARIGSALFRMEVTMDHRLPGWQLRVPLGPSGYVQVGRGLHETEPVELAPFLELIRGQLLPRLSTLGPEAAAVESVNVSLNQLADRLTELQTEHKLDVVGQ